MFENARVILSLILHTGIVLLTGNALIMGFKREREQHPDSHETHLFRYFTTDSNVFSALVSLCLVIFLAGMLTGHVSALPRFLLLSDYMASVSVFVTFMTVMVFLAPITSYAQMLSGPDLYMHLVNPLLAVISYAFLLPGEALPFATTFFSLVPTVLYGILYIYKVLIKGEEKGGWSDFYTFNRNGAWPLSLILMLTGTYVLGLLLYFARSRFG